MNFTMTAKCTAERALDQQLVAIWNNLAKDLALRQDDVGAVLRARSEMVIARRAYQAAIELAEELDANGYPSSSSVPSSVPSVSSVVKGS